LCHQGYCLRADDEFMGNALIITENGQWADWSTHTVVYTKEEDGGGNVETFVFGLAKSHLYVVLGALVFCVCCCAIACCVKSGTTEGKENCIDDEYDTDEDENVVYLADVSADNAQSHSEYKRRYVI